MRLTKRERRRLRRLKEEVCTYGVVACCILSAGCAITSVMKLNSYEASSQSALGEKSIVEIILPIIQSEQPIISSEKKSVPQLEEETTSTNMYTTCLVNLREYSTTESNVLEKVKVGTSVEVLSYKTGWSYVVVDGDAGYICSDYLSEDSPFILTSSTAYYNPDNNKTADCSDTIANLTLAGMVEWLGQGCYLYECNDDGSVGSCMGYYEFHDIGWGRDGDILRGETVDIYMETEEECVAYGRQNVYVLFVE